jgi:lipooligosaccharide transport system ATP-binding protein
VQSETEFAGDDPVCDTPGMTSRPVVAARSLVKRFGDFTAVAGIDVEIAPGEAFGFLGPNGAGKTSTMRMIGCVSPVSDGTLRIFGLDPATDGRTIRGRMGVVPQLDQLDSELTVEENLLIYGRYFDLSRAQCRAKADELLDFVQLDEKRGSKVDSLSGGQKRRVSIARSLVNDPELLLLDEPTTGLDPQARHVLWDRLYQLKERGSTQVITTHFMDEAEQLCDRLVVMDGGLIVAEGSPQALIREHIRREVLEVRFGYGRNMEQLPALEGVGDRIEVLPDRLLIYDDDGEAALSELHRREIVPESALVRRSSLEDVFLKLTGRTLIE